MIAMIAAYAKNRVIGNKGRIPWNIPGEQSRFRELTTGNVVIMGRKTYEEIGHSLPNRYTIVVSATKSFEAESCITRKSLKEALEAAGERDVFISGGERLYREAVGISDVLYITEVDAEPEGDTYFPDFPEEAFVKETEKIVKGNIGYTYVTYTRK